ncbi:MAG: hypothetical protein IJ224_03305 [Lachnospiraceae bacterium]|nr:hypothetical protein [Lachnospiraceae bacterium]
MKKNNKEIRFFVIFSILAIVFRLFISSNSPYAVTPQYYYDHGLLVKYAINMSEGKWLGAYNCVTLSKGIGFSVFLFLSNVLNIPYNILFCLFIVFSCLLFTYSIKPFVKNYYVLSFVFAFMLFCPVSFSHIFGMGIYRNAIVPWTVLGYVSGIIGIYLWTINKNDNYKNLIFWSIITAVYFSYFWILREDSFWILPFTLVSGLIIIIIAIIQRKEKGNKRSIIVICAILLQLFLCICTNIFIAYMNYKNYGIFTTNDRTGTYFADVLSDLHHIDAGEQSDDVWISRKQLDIAFRESKTLSSVQDGVVYLWDRWAAGEENELPGDIGQWALRDGVSYAGYYDDMAVETNELFHQIHNELQEAFKDGRIEEREGLYLSSQARALKIDDFFESFKISTTVWKNIRKYYYCDMQEYSIPLGTGVNDVVTWENFLGIYGVKEDEYMSQMNVNEIYINQNRIERFNQARISFLANKITKVYKLASYILAPLMWLGYIAIFVMMILDIKSKRKETKSFFVWLLLTGILLCEFVHIYVSTLFSRWLDAEKNGSSSYYYNYAPAGYILIQIAEIGCILYVASRLILMIKEKKKRVENDK